MISVPDINFLIVDTWLVSNKNDINNGTYYLRVASIESFNLDINLDTWGIISFNPKIDIQLLFPYMTFCKDFQRRNPLVHEIKRYPHTQHWFNIQDSIAKKCKVS